jgi:M6 family metalloprotease-like protein
MISLHRTVRRCAAATSIAALFSACGGGGDASSGPSTPTTPITPAVASVALSATTLSIDVGATGTLTATALSASGATITGKTAAWSSSNAAVAAVAGGVVTGVSAGTATITADIDGKQASAAVTVSPVLPSLLEAVSGDNQRGLTGRALADSIVIRAKTAAGAPAANASLSLTASSGSLSSPAVTTDANGLARVQWTAGTGDATTTVTLSGSKNLVVRANGRASGACSLAAGNRLSLGPTDPTLNLSATGSHKFVVLFADFSDAPAQSTDTFQSFMDVVNAGITMLGELSYGRAQVSATAVQKWYRVPVTSDFYDLGTFAGHRDYIRAVMTAADADVDFSQYDGVYVFVPATASVLRHGSSRTLEAGTTGTNTVVFDGKVFPNAVTYRRDIRVERGASIVAHETGHMFGLVDLYTNGTIPATGPYPGNTWQDFGNWSLMSNGAVRFLAWEARKLGYLDAAQVDCIEGTGGEEVTLQPIETTGGIKAVAVPLTSSRALVVEVRSKQGLDASQCASGVLIYEVDASKLSGTGVGVVRGSRATTSGSLYATCGPWPDATYDLGTGQISSYTDAASGVTVQLLGTDSNGAFRIRVKKS